MRPEAAAFLEQATRVIGRAGTMLGVGLHEDAARAAYLACFHVAQAYIFERTEKIFKSHREGQAESSV